MPHHMIQMSSFSSGTKKMSIGSHKTVDHPVYLLARDEDCENTFHSSADFVSYNLLFHHFCKYVIIILFMF